MQTRLVLLVGLLWAGVLPSAGAHDPAPMTREQTLALYSRSYPGKDDKVVFEGIRQIFALADVPRDVAIEYPDPHTMVVTREGGGFPMPIRFNWRFDVSPSEGGVQVTATLRTAAGAMFTTPGGGRPTVHAVDAVALLFARLDYLLGVSGQWTSCKQYSATHKGHDPIDALCFKAVDATPTAPLGG